MTVLLDPSTSSGESSGQSTQAEGKLTWCSICRAYGPGKHRPDGSFDQYSVSVTKGEIQRAMQNAVGMAPRYRALLLRDLENPVRRKRTRYNIALGKHIGVYDHPPQRREA